MLYLYFSFRAFGDGDHGKLGLGHCTSKSTPTIIDALSGKNAKKIVKIGAGKHFSVFLTEHGQVLTCGFSEWTGLSDSFAKLNKPCPVPGTQCGKYGNLLSHFFGKNLVKTTFLLTKLLSK